MALIDLISPEVVKIPLSERNKPDIIRELLSLLEGAGKVLDSEAAYEPWAVRDWKTASPSPTPRRRR